VAAYFDKAEAFDLTLLHLDARAHDDLARVVDEAELEIIERFTREEPSPLAAPDDSHKGIYEVLENEVWYTTYLWGYEPAAADAAGFSATRSAWTGFAKAMRLTVARVASHRIRHYDALYGVSAETHGRESWTYAARRELAWPPDWDSLLRRYVPARYDPRIVHTL
jgi:hypothetical protein